MIRSGDTSTAARARQLDSWRRMTPAERLGVAADMSDALRRLVEAGVRSRHPEAAESEVHELVAEALLGPDVVSVLHRLRAGRVG